jgi:hypothetical protein
MGPDVCELCTTFFWSVTSHVCLGGMESSTADYCSQWTTKTGATTRGHSQEDEAPTERKFSTCSCSSTCITIPMVISSRAEWFALLWAPGAAAGPHLLQ